MYKEAKLISFFYGITLVVTATTTIVTAGLLGPSDFGKYAALQSVAAILIPCCTLRIETRIATCVSAEELSRLLSATMTSAVLFVAVGCAISPILGLYFEWKLIVAVIILAASSAVLDTLISCCAYKGETWELVKFRAIRQVLPSVTVLMAVFFFADLFSAVFALVLSTLVCLIIFLLPRKEMLALSTTVLRQTVHEHAQGLRASLMLGGLNVVWINGLLPLMNAMGLSIIAGQYAIVQRLINTPLNVVGVSISSVLLKRGNRLHEAKHSIAFQACILFCIAILVSALLYGGIYIQTEYVFPLAWKMPEPLFIAASFFLACSFAVGTVSIVGVRLKDEWFLAYWQLVFMVVWALILVVFRSSEAFVYMLVIGGIGYWILLARWVIISGKKYG